MDKSMLVSEEAFRKWLAGEAGQKPATDEWFKEISQKGVQVTLSYKNAAEKRSEQSHQVAWGQEDTDA